MAVERIVCSDWSGGQSPRLAAHQFSERQWASLRGVVIEDQTRVRSQWPCQKVGSETGFDELGTVRGRNVARKPDGTFWWSPLLLSGATYTQGRDHTWTQLTEISPDPDLHIVCQAPLIRDSGVGFQEALILNGRDRNGPAYALYPSGVNTGGEMNVHTFAEWPEDSNAEDDGWMPPANIGTMWGDFLVLGDIKWLANEDSPISATNNRNHPNLLWFSDPTDIGKWDVLDTVPVAFYDDIGSGSITVRDAQQVDAGLMVITHSGAALLRGTADDHTVEPLRAGTGAARSNCATYWSQTGTVCWIDAGGRLWSTNGEEFVRLNEGTALPARKDVATEVAAIMEYLLVAHQDGRLLYVRALEEEGVWGELIPGGANPHSFVVTGGVVNWLDDAGQVWRFTMAHTRDDERGLVDGAQVDLRIATRTVQRGGGHHKTFHHRCGVRGHGPGTLETLTLRPGPALGDDQPKLEHTLGRSLDDRDELVVRSFGPAVESSADLTLRGDIQVEGVTFYIHEGRGSR